MRLSEDGEEVNLKELKREEWRVTIIIIFCMEYE